MMNAGSNKLIFLPHQGNISLIMEVILFVIK